MPQQSGHTSSVALTPARTGSSRTRSPGRQSTLPRARSTAAPTRLVPPPPPLPRVDGGPRLSPRRLSRLPARPPWAGDLRRTPHCGAAGPSGPGAMPHPRACVAAPPLTPPFTPRDRQPLSCVGRVPPPAPPPLARATVAPPLSPLRWVANGTFLPSCGCVAGTRNATRARGAGQRHLSALALAHGCRV